MDPSENQSNSSKGLRDLTEGQKDVLRLVLLHLNSKEIGQRLVISPHTVDDRMRQAIRVLAAKDRWQASRMLAVHEGALPAEDEWGKASESDIEPDGLSYDQPTPPSEGKNSLNPTQRIGVILALAAAILIGFGALLGGLEAFSRLIG